MNLVSTSLFETMDEIISILKTPEECMQLAKVFTDLARQARRRAIELRASAHGKKTEVEKELLKAIYAYEEILSTRNNRRTSASRTWQMINRYGIIGGAERAVNRKTDAMGYRLLVEMGLQDLTFEAVIVRYPKVFNQDIVKLCIERLDELNKI